MSKSDQVNQQNDIDNITARMRALNEQAPRQPILRRYRTNDTTSEKFGEMLAENPRGMIVVRDELVGLLASWEKRGREDDRSLYLEGWNGFGSFDTDRIGRGSIHIPNLCISIFGGTQPDKLLAFLRQTTDALSNDGAIQRFQMLVFPDAYRWAYVDRSPNAAARDKVYDLFKDIADLDPVDIGASPQDEYNDWPYFNFSTEAQAFFKERTTDLNSRKILEEENPLVVEHLGKYDKLFCALALIFHMADCVAGQKSGPVTLQAAKMSAEWCNYLETHARRCYGLLVDSTMYAAQNLIQKIQKGKLEDGFTLNELKRKGWSGLTKKDDVQEALDWLEDTHWIRGYDTKATSSGGRGTRKYKINPKVAKHGAAKTADT